MRFRTLALLGSVAAAAACGGGSNGGPSPTGPSSTLPGVPGVLDFKTSPIAMTALRFITPLGNLNPAAHTIPTDHIYFYFADPDAGESPVGRRTDVFVPADGVVSTVIVSEAPDTKVFVQVAAGVMYYVDHVIPAIALATGTKVTAGQRLGTTGSAYAMDLGVINNSVTQAFVNPSRYIGDTLHADAPLKYFDEPLRSQLYSRVQRIGADLDGAVDEDVAGRLAGNWYQEQSATPIAFAFDTYDPAQPRISIAAVLMIPRTAVYAIGAGEPSPRDVSAASGPVVYTLTTSRTGPPVVGGPAGRLLVQMLDDQHVQVELLADGAAAAFTSNAVRYTR